MYIFNWSSKNPAKFKTTTCRCWMLLYGELAGYVVVSSCNCAENLKRERRGFAASHSPRLSSPCGGGESDSNPGKVPRPTEVWRRPRRWAVGWRGPPLSARSAFCFIDRRGRRPEIDKTTPWEPSLLCVCPQLASLCRSLCRSLYAVRCAVRYAVRACRADSRDPDRAEGLPRWIFIAPFLLKTRKAKYSSRRSLMVISGRMLRQLVGDQVATSENSRPAACFAMPFVQGWLSRSSKRTSPLNGWFMAPFLLQNTQGCR